VGRRAEAVAPIEEAVGIYRRLAVAAPDAYLPDLARSLHNLALVQAETDARDDAWLPVTQSIATYGELTTPEPDIFLLDLRDALALAIDLAQKSEQDTMLQDL
jgi:hypothetical protein